MIVECVKENSYDFQVGKKYRADNYPTNVANLTEAYGVYNKGMVTYFSKREINTIFCKVYSHPQ